MADHAGCRSCPVSGVSDVPRVARNDRLCCPRHRSGGMDLLVPDRHLRICPPVEILQLHQKHLLQRDSSDVRKRPQVCRDPRPHRRHRLLFADAEEHHCDLESDPVMDPVRLCSHRNDQCAVSLPGDPEAPSGGGEGGNAFRLCIQRERRRGSVRSRLQSRAKPDGRGEPGRTGAGRHSTGTSHRPNQSRPAWFRANRIRPDKCLPVQPHFQIRYTACAFSRSTSAQRSGSISRSAAICSIT